MSIPELANVSGRLRANAETLFAMGYILPTEWLDKIASDVDVSISYLEQFKVRLQETKQEETANVQTSDQITI